MVDLDADRDEWIAGLTDADAPDEPPAPPEDAFQANRMLRWIRREERELAELADYYEAERAHLDGWYEDRTAGHRRRIAQIGRALEGWWRKVSDETGKLSHTLPDGKTSLRAVRPKVKITSDERAVRAAYSLDRGEWVRVKSEIDRTKIAEDLYPGELVAGDAALGHELREACAVTGWRWSVFVAVPVPSVVPGLALEWPTDRKFSYTTIKAKETDRGHEHGND